MTLAQECLRLENIYLIVHENMSCDVKNVIYVMKCRGCGEEYIGETGNLLRQRVLIDNQQIRDPSTRMLKVREHISYCPREHVM